MGTNESNKLKQQLQEFRDAQFKELKEDIKATIDDFEDRIRNLEEASARYVGMGYLGKIVLPVLLTLGANILIKLIWK